MGRAIHQPRDEHEIEIVGDTGFERASVMEDIQAGGRDKFSKSGDTIRGLSGLSSNTKRQVSRKINKFHAGKDKTTKSKAVHAEQITGYALFDVVSPPYNLDYLAKLYEISAAHKAAVDAKVSNIVGLGYEWIESHHTVEKLQGLEGEQLARARRKVERGKNGMTHWLEDCNAEDTFDEIMKNIWTDLETTGNGYMEIGRKKTGEIGYIGHIPSTTIRVRAKKDGYVQIVDRKVIFFRNYGEDTTDPIGDDPEPNEIIHFKKYTSSSSYYGVPDIISATNAVAGNEFAARFNLDYFEHKAVPRYIVTLKGAKLSETSEAKLVNFLSSGLKGQHHRTLYIPLPSDDGETKVEFKMEAVEAKIQDASFIGYYKHNRTDILMAHRVPPTKVGLSEGVSLAVARDADKMFKEQVCRPAQRVIEKKLRTLFGEKTDALEFKLKELTLTDEETMSKIHERRIRMKMQTPNEARADIGLPSYDGGDEMVEIGGATARNQRADARNSRRRSQERDSNAPDNDGESRNPQGEGRQTE